MERDVTVWAGVIEFECVHASGESFIESGSSDLDLARQQIELIENNGGKVVKATLKQSYVVKQGSGSSIPELKVVFTMSEFDELTQDYVEKALMDGLSARRMVR